MAITEVVADTSPLINLAGLVLLDLLPHLYGVIWIPGQVAEEYRVGSQAGDPELAAVPGFRVLGSVPIDLALSPLGSGEAAVISLAKSSDISVVLLDEKKARRVAAGEGLLPIGTLAVLRRAKEHGFVPRLAPLLATMQAQGRHFSNSLMAQVLRDAGE